MINFRYHIVSLMAVFLALSVGIVIGVTLRPSVDEGLAQQAAQDRKQVQELRAELDRRNALDRYREAYAQGVGPSLTAGSLDGTDVALIVLPDAPGAVTSALSAAVDSAGGSLTRTVEIRGSVFEPEAAETVNMALADFAGTLGFTDDMSPATKVGLALGRSVLTRPGVGSDPQASAIRSALSDAGLVAFDTDQDLPAQLAVVVTAEATDPAPAEDVVAAHVELELALDPNAGGVVIAGPNSGGITGTDVAAVRGTTSAAEVLSTVDVADLASGVTTVVLAGQEQLLGRHGHYGAFGGADAALPTLPVR